MVTLKLCCTIYFLPNTILNCDFSSLNSCYISQRPLLKSSVFRDCTFHYSKDNPGHNKLLKRLRAFPSLSLQCWFGRPLCPSKRVKPTLRGGEGSNKCIYERLRLCCVFRKCFNKLWPGLWRFCRYNSSPLLCDQANSSPNCMILFLGYVVKFLTM